MNWVKCINFKRQTFKQKGFKVSAHEVQTCRSDFAGLYRPDACFLLKQDSVSIWGWKSELQQHVMSHYCNLNVIPHLTGVISLTRTHTCMSDHTFCTLKGHLTASSSHWTEAGGVLISTCLRPVDSGSVYRLRETATICWLQRWFMSKWVAGDPWAGSQTLRRITSEQNANNLWPAVGQQLTTEEGKRWVPPPNSPSIHQPIPLLATIYLHWLMDKRKGKHSVDKIIQARQSSCSYVTNTVLLFLCSAASSSNSVYVNIFTVYAQS